MKKIVIWPDPILTQRSTEVVHFDDYFKQLVKDLKDGMTADGIAGLSAPQIGILKRVFVIDISPEDNDGNGTNGIEVFVNPYFTDAKGSFSWEEGCMSIPGLRGKVTRHDQITMHYQDEHGNHMSKEAFYYLSGCFQHEIDHLNGILWVDHQSPMKKSIIKRKMQAFKKTMKN